MEKFCLSHSWELKVKLVLHVSTLLLLIVGQEKPLYVKIVPFCLQVVLGFAFRMYDWLTTSFNIHTKTCYTVNRGYNQPPVQSCEGKKYKQYAY